MKTLLYLILALVWVGITLACDFFAVNAVRQQVRAEHFPSVVGLITHNTIDATPGGKGGPRFQTLLRYTYTVAGRDYVGDHHRYGGYTASRSHAEALAARFPIGAPATVYFNPDDPADAILDPGVDGVDVFALFFLLPFNLVLIGALIGLAHQRPAGGKLFASTGPLTAGLAALMVGWFAIVIAIAVFAGFEPSLPVALGAWALLATLSLGAAAYAKFKRG